MCQTVNRLADLCNARNDPPGSRSNVSIGNVQDPDSFIIRELVECAAWFAEWKHNCDRCASWCKVEDMFLAWETWADVQSCTLGIAALSSYYLKKFPGSPASPTFIPQRRLGTDKVEHHFAHIRGSRPGTIDALAAAQAQNAAAIAASINHGSSLQAVKRSNNAGGADTDAKRQKAELKQAGLRKTGAATVGRRTTAARKRLKKQRQDKASTGPPLT
jgi:hypothetical protein